MRSLIFAAALLAGASVPIAAGAASYTPTAPVAAVNEVADSQRVDVHYRSYRAPFVGFYWGAPPYRYGHYHDHRHYDRSRYDHDWRHWRHRKYDRDWGRWDRHDGRWKHRRSHWR